MTHLLDLSITLTKPPLDSPPDALANIALHCDGLRLSLKGNLLCDPFTQQERKDLLWYLEEYWKWPYPEVAEGGRQVEGLLPQFCRRLYEAIFGYKAATSILQTWQPLSDQQQISIISDLLRVLGLPRELLHDEEGFSALHVPSAVAIVRRTHQCERVLWVLETIEQTAKEKLS